MISSVDYFYEGSRRLNFGFENPNKAAVIFSCLLPLLFLGWNLVWSLKNPWWLNACTLIAAGICIVTDALCLFKTYSRGGAAASVVGVGYLLISLARPRFPFRNMQVFRSARFNSTGALVTLLVALFFWVGLGERSLEPITNGDASVSHRLVLWRSALQMAVENPLGFGTGKSGEAYMQWYQAVDATAEYRTMVNSYLTFLVEQGWLWSGVVLLVGTLFWFWSSPAKSGLMASEIALGLRASILAFLVSGIFSTIMEEPILWIIPAGCALLLLMGALSARTALSRTQAGLALALTVLMLSALYMGGWMQSRSDPLSRTFARSPEGITLSELALKNSSDGKTWVVVPDEKILGPLYGKLLRQLVMETSVTLKLENAENLRGPIDRLLLTGDAVQGSPVTSQFSTILLAPTGISPSDAQGWLTSSPHLEVSLPSIDEDGRGRFWQESVVDSKLPAVTITRLNGVGLRVDWAWDQVISLIKRS